MISLIKCEAWRNRIYQMGLDFDMPWSTQLKFLVLTRFKRGRLVSKEGTLNELVNRRRIGDPTKEGSDPSSVSSSTFELLAQALACLAAICRQIRLNQ
jgi:hypothetical protein